MCGRLWIVEAASCRFPRRRRPLGQATRQDCRVYIIATSARPRTGPEVFGRDAGLDVVDRVEHEAAAAAEDLDPLADLRRISSGVPKGSVFCVSTPPPQKVSFAAEPLLQRPRVHAGRRALHRVEDVEPGVDDVRQQGDHRAAASG